MLLGKCDGPILQRKELRLREVACLRLPRESGQTELESQCGSWGATRGVLAHAPLRHPEGTIMLLQVPVYILSWVINPARDL